MKWWCCCRGRHCARLGLCGHALGQEEEMKNGMVVLLPWAALCTIRVGQNHIDTPYMTVYLVISLPKVPYMHRIYIYTWLWANLCMRGCVITHLDRSSR